MYTVLLPSICMKAWAEIALVITILGLSYLICKMTRSNVLNGKGITLWNAFVYVWLFEEDTYVPINDSGFWAGGLRIWGKRKAYLWILGSVWWLPIFKNHFLLFICLFIIIIILAEYILFCLRMHFYFFKFIYLFILSNLYTQHGAWPWDQELHTLLTEPARCPSKWLFKR